MKNRSYEYVGKISPGQDGAIYKDYLFRFDEGGNCKVFSLKNWEMISEFLLDKVEILTPHSNSVCFGNEFYEETDEFPLLYTNIYNTYSSKADRKEGMCCVYRLFREGRNFTTQLVQVIQIGFVNDLSLWKSLEQDQDVRPYGNFIVDTDRSRLYAFVMRDSSRETRYFEFSLPKAVEGAYSEEYQAKVVEFEKEDIRSMFDCEYSNYVQGACYHDGKIYSLEGFAGETEPPRLQVIDLEEKEQDAVIELYQMGLIHEPEFIYFKENTLYYADNPGNVYVLRLE